MVEIEADDARSEPEVGDRHRHEDLAFAPALESSGDWGATVAAPVGGATQRGDTTGCRVRPRTARAPGVQARRRTTRPGRRSRSARSASSARTGSTTSTTRTQSRCGKFVSERGKIRARRVTGNCVAAPARRRDGRQERPRDGPAPVLVAMKIILQKPVDKLGVPGDVVEVADGYARNYLIPRGLAVKAEKGARQARRDAHAGTRVAAVQAEGRVRSDRLQADLGRSVTIAARAGEEGKLFGSVTADRDRRGGRGPGRRADRPAATSTSTSRSARSAPTRSGSTCSTRSSR